MKRRLAAVFARIDRFVRDGEIDGAALAVAHQGEMIAEEYVGQASVSQPAGPEILWPLALATKQ